MACDLSNPDISGIGVRIAIYVQNLLSFAPVVMHLWDHNVTRNEIKSTEGQSIGILALAFSILISTILEATTVTGINGFQATVILDLSWINNTTTFIWFLMYAHHRSKSTSSAYPVAATWSAWKAILLPSLKALTDGHRRRKNVKPSHDYYSDFVAVGQTPTLVRRIWNLISRSPVLTMGSIHLSIMAAIGIWLWSNPSGFGSGLQCDPSLSVFGAHTQLSSQVLRVASLFLYSMLLVPGINLVLPFFILISPHIIYNQHQQSLFVFINRCRLMFRKIIHLFQSLSVILLIRRRDNHEAQVYNLDEPLALSELPPPKVDAKLLVIGLGFLFVVNIIFVADVENTLATNKQFQLTNDNQWGFGQVLSLLLLLVPLRDLFKGFMEIQLSKEESQRRFEKALLSAVTKKPLDGREFQDYIERGANPNTRIEGHNLLFSTLLNYTVYVGNLELVEYLLERNDVKEDDSGSYILGMRKDVANDPGLRYPMALQISLHEGHIETAYAIIQKGYSIKWDHAMLTFVHHIEESLNNSNPDLRCTIIQCLPDLHEHDIFNSEIHPIIPHLGKYFVDHDMSVRVAALHTATFISPEEIWSGLSANIADWSDLGSDVRCTVLHCCSDILEKYPSNLHSSLRANIGILVRHIASGLVDNSKNVRDAAVRIASALSTEDLVDIWEFLLANIAGWNNLSSDIRCTVLDCLSNLVKRSILFSLRKTPHSVISHVTRCLVDDSKDVREAAVHMMSCLSATEDLAEIWDGVSTNIANWINLSSGIQCTIHACLLVLIENPKAVNFLPKVKSLIPHVVECMFDDHEDVRKAAVRTASSLSTEEIWSCLSPKIADWSNIPSHVRCTILNYLSHFIQRSSLSPWPDVQDAISLIVRSLADDDASVRIAALDTISHGWFRIDCSHIYRVASRDIYSRGIYCNHPSQSPSELVWPPVSRIVDCLRDTNKGVSDAACNILSNREFQGSFREELRHRILVLMNDWTRLNPLLQCRAVQCLPKPSPVVTFFGRFRGCLDVSIKSHAPSVVKYLVHEDHDVRSAAFAALINLPLHVTPENLNSLTKDWTSLHPQLRCQVISYLLYIAQHQNLPDTVWSHIVKSLVDADKGVRKEALFGITRFNNLSNSNGTTIADTVNRMYYHGSENERTAALQAMLKLDWAHHVICDWIPIIVKSLSYPQEDIRQGATKRLHELGADETFYSAMEPVVPLLLKLLSLDNTKYPENVLSCLLKIFPLMRRRKLHLVPSIGTL